VRGPHSMFWRRLTRAFDKHALRPYQAISLKGERRQLTHLHTDGSHHRHPTAHMHQVHGMVPATSMQQQQQRICLRP
jgi:hypothetical protein